MHLLLPDYPSWKVMSALRPDTTLSAIDVLTSRRNSTGCAAYVGYRRHRETVSHVTMTCESAGHVAPEATSRRQHAYSYSNSRARQQGSRSNRYNGSRSRPATSGMRYTHSTNDRRQELYPHMCLRRSQLRRRRWRDRRDGPCANFLSSG